jgi:nucleoside-diphosphate-sugar epimerase/cell division protein FtsB
MALRQHQHRVLARLGDHLEASRVASVRHTRSGRSGKGVANAEAELARQVKALAEEAAAATARVDSLEARVKSLETQLAGGEPHDEPDDTQPEAAEEPEPDPEATPAPPGDDVLRVAVLGGTGHVGSYLCPRLGEDPRFHCICVSRSTTSVPYAAAGGSWDNVERVALDRTGADHNSPVLSDAASDSAAAAEAAFGQAVVALDADVVIDMICFTKESCQRLVEALKGSRCKHFLHVGSIWAHGHSRAVPTPEGLPHEREPLEEYGQAKNEIEMYLLHSDEAAEIPFACTVLHAGHIVGRGWPPLNPQGHFNPQVFATLAKGEPLLLPNLGQETVHHIHADDIARCFIACMEQRDASAGQAFHIVSPQAVSLRHLAIAVTKELFDLDVKLEFAHSWEQFAAVVDETDAAQTLTHIEHSPSCSMAKIKEHLGFESHHDSISMVVESARYLIENGMVEGLPL